MTKLFVDANASCKVGNLMDTCPDGKNSGLVKELGSSNKYIRGEQDIIYSSVNKSPLFDYDEESGTLFIPHVHTSLHSKEIVGEQEYQACKAMYDFIDDLDVFEDFKKILCNRISEMPYQLKNIFKHYAPRLVCLNATHEESLFNSLGNYFIFNQYEDYYNNLGCGNTFIHEVAHMISKLMKDDGIISAMSIKTLTWCAKNDFNNYLLEVMKSKHIDEKHAKEIIQKEIRDHGCNADIVSDIYGGITNNEVVGAFLHDTEYWTESNDETLIGEEFFAEVIASLVCHRTESISLAKKYLHTTMLQFYKIMEGIHLYEQ